MEQDRDQVYLIDERPPWIGEADRYVSWYEDVESTIVLLLKCVGIEVDPGRTPQGTHAFHENVLKEVQHQKNFYHNALGCGRVHEALWQAKSFRNLWRSKTLTKCRGACQRYLYPVSNQKKMVEAGLLAAFRILATKNAPSETDTMQQIQVQQQRLDKGREDLEREKKAFNESRALRKEEVEKDLADQEKTSQSIMARFRATLQRERETLNEDVGSITADLHKRSAEIKKEKSSLQRALQDHRKLEAEVSDLRLAHSTCALGECESAKGFESQSRSEQNRMMKLQEKLDTQTAELKRIQDEEATRNDYPDISREDLCAILYRHGRSQNTQELPTVTEEGTEDGSKNLARMLRDLLTSHAREVNEAKVAKERQRKLQEEIESLGQRLADAEAQNSTDRLVVETALSRMEGCVDSGIRILRSFFTKQKTHRDSGSQMESSTST